MSNIDYRLFKEVLYKDCCRIIEDFAATEQNKDVYAFVITTAIEYGSIGVNLNTLGGFEEIRNKYYKNYPDEKLYGVWGLKYNTGDFRYGYGFSEEVTAFVKKRREESDREFDQGIESFSLEEEPINKIVIEVLRELEEELKKLNQTKDFISFPSYHDLDMVMQIELMKKSIPLDRMYLVFPEIKAYEDFMNRILQKNKEEQMDCWLKVMEDFSMKRDSEDVLLLKSCQRDMYDAIREIKKFGKDVLPKVWTMLDTYGMCEEVNYEFCSLPKEVRIKLVREDKTGTLSVWTKEGKTTHTLIKLIVELGGEQDLPLLQNLLQYWLDKTKDLEPDFIGQNVSILASGLNALAGHLFPYPRMSKDKRLENYQDYSVTL